MRHRFRDGLGWLLAVVLAVGIYSLRGELGTGTVSRAGLPGEAQGAELSFAGEPAGLPEEADRAPAQLSQERYVYTTLDEECRRVYDELYEALLLHADSVRVSTLDEGVIEEAYRAIGADHGEIFWVSGYSYTRYTQGGNVIGLEFAPNYTKTRGERDALQEEIDRSVSEILSGISAEASDYEKAKYVFEYLASEVDYRAGAQDNQNIVSVFVYGETVCQGYASAMQYLLTVLGLQSAVVTGLADGTLHAWNLVRMDGEYYYVDPTWGNPGYGGEEETERFVDYSYFGLTTEDMERTHMPNDYFTLPDCTATKDNYYARENLYFAEWDADALGALCTASYEAGQTGLSVRFASRELCEDAVRYLIDERHISDYCEGMKGLYYVENDRQNVLTFRFS